MAGREKQTSSRAGAPTSMPEGTPSLASPTDHSFTLQAIMEMNKTLGVLSAKVENLGGTISSLDARVEGFADKLDKVRHWQSVVSGGAIVIAAIAAIIWAVITFIPWDRVRIEAKPTAQQVEPNR